jgi:hypothetical protein
MAITNTALLNALAELSDPANKDMRVPNYGATKTFNKYKKNVILNYDEFNLIRNQSDLQTKQIDYLKRVSGTVNSYRSASLSGEMPDSVRDTLTFVTYSRQFTISDDVARNNTQKAQKQIVAQIRNSRLDIGSEIEDAAVAKLELFKNTVQGDRGLGTWNDTTYTMGIANGSKTEYYNYIESEMRALDYSGMLQEVHNHTLNSLINYQTAQGGNNSANLQFQYPNFEFEMTNAVETGGYSTDYFGNSYVIPAGTIALVDWIPGKNREGYINHGLWDFTAMPDPFGLFDTMAVAVYKTVQDSSSGGEDIGGNTQDAVWLYEVSIDVAFYIPALSTGKLVQKYGLLTA